MISLLRLLLVLLADTLPAHAQVGLVAAFPCIENTGTTIADITATHRNSGDGSAGSALHPSLQRMFRRRPTTWKWASSSWI